MNNYARTFVILMGVIYVAVILSISIDWLTKYTTYLEYRDAFYAAADNGYAVVDVDKLKSTSAYFQGAATRSLNTMADTAITLSVAWVGLALFFRIWREVD